MPEAESGTKLNIGSNLLNFTASVNAAQLCLTAQERRKTVARGECSSHLNSETHNFFMLLILYTLCPVLFIRMYQVSPWPTHSGD
jgi:hypothetical protein